MISPQPSRFRMNRRKTVSVTPAMGASTVAGAMVIGPMENLGGKTCIAGADFNSSICLMIRRKRAVRTLRQKRCKQDSDNETAVYRTLDRRGRCGRRRPDEGGRKAEPGSDR